MRPLYKLGNAAVAALPSPQHDAAQCATVLRTCRKEEFSLERLSFSFLQGERYQPLYFQENIYAHTLSRRSTTHTLAAVDPALALHTGDLAEAPAQCPQGDRIGAPVLRLW